MEKLYTIEGLEERIDSIIDDINIEETYIEKKERKKNHINSENPNLLKKKKKNINISQKNVLSFLSEKIDEVDENTVLKMISESHFNVINFIEIIAKKEAIEEFIGVSFRIGKKEAKTLASLVKKGRIKRIDLFISKLQEKLDNDSVKKDEKYNYFKDVEKILKNDKISMNFLNSHLKLYLLKTTKNSYILETSANLNKNAKSEFFILSNDEKDFKLYKKYFMERKK